MNKKKATKETIDSFVKAVYPEMTELAMTFASEESILRDATEQIAALKERACCLPSNDWGHTKDCIREQIATLKATVTGSLPEEVWVVAVAKYEEEIAALEAERDDLQAMLVAGEPPYYTKWKKQMEQIAVLNARVSELEGALRLCLAVSPDDPLIITPVEKEAVMLKDQIAALKAEITRLISMLAPFLADKALRGEGVRMSYNLAELRTVATKACYDAHDHSRDIADAVNWGDLSCVSAERCESDEGDTRYLVVIEEAAPGANNLQKYIAVYLATHGFPGVEVITEW